MEIYGHEVCLQNFNLTETINAFYDKNNLESFNKIITELLFSCLHVDDEQ